MRAPPDIHKDTHQELAVPCAPGRARGSPTDNTQLPGQLSARPDGAALWGPIVLTQSHYLMGGCKGPTEEPAWSHVLVGRSQTHL